MKLHSPSVARNTQPIIDVLRDWLPPEGTILELASGSGEHVLAFARAFPQLTWQPSDRDASALASIDLWAREEGPGNLRPPLRIDVEKPDWGPVRADGVIAINLVHISAWSASLGLLDGAARILPAGAPLILYGPWLVEGKGTAPSNLAFDADLRARDPEWGLREVGRFAAEAEARGLKLQEKREMPANNRMLRFVREL